MTPLRVLASRLLAIMTARRRDAELTDEIRAHLDLLADAHVRDGMSAEAARAAARRDFGGVEQVKETYRDQRGLPFVETLTQDIRYALRALRASPGFAAATMLSLALGIGANSAVFTVVNAALMRDLPVEDPDRLATVYWRSPAAVARGEFKAVAGNDFSYPVFRELASRQTVFSDLAARDSGRARDDASDREPVVRAGADRPHNDRSRHVDHAGRRRGRGTAAREAGREGRSHGCAQTSMTTVRLKPDTTYDR